MAEVNDIQCHPHATCSLGIHTPAYFSDFMIVLFINFCNHQTLTIITKFQFQPSTAALLYRTVDKMTSIMPGYTA